MPLALSTSQIESVKNRIDFDRRFVVHFFSDELLEDGSVVEELVASTRAEVNPSLIKWIKRGKAPYEVLAGSGFGGGGALNPRQDIYALIEELWIECLKSLSDQQQLDKKKVRKAVNQGRRTAIAAAQKNKLILRHIKRDRNKK